MSVPRRIALSILSLLVLSSCASSTPPLARDLPRAFGPTSDFDKRIQQRFPAYSDEAALIAELRSERFTIDAVRDPSMNYRHMAFFKRQAFPCRESWTILWNGEQGMILKIEGRNSGEICL